VSLSRKTSRTLHTVRRLYVTDTECARLFDCVLRFACDELRAGQHGVVNELTLKFGSGFLECVHMRSPDCASVSAIYSFICIRPTVHITIKRDEVK